MIAKNFTKNLNEIMEKKNISTKKLAVLMNTSYERIRMIRGGYWYPRLENVEEFANALGVDAIAMLEEWE